MNIHSLIGLIALVTNTAIAVFVWWRNPDDKVNRIFSLLGASISMWVFGCFMQALRVSPQTAYFFDKVTYIGVAVAPTLYMHLLLAMSGLDKQRPHRNVLYANYFLSFSFLTINFVEPIRAAFIVDVIKRYPYRYIAVAGTYYYLYLLFYLWSLLYGVYLLTRGTEYKNGYRLNQMKYLVLGFFTVTLAAAFYFSQVFGAKIPPLDAFFVVLYGFFMVYAIVQYRLMNIEIVFRRTFIFTMIFGFSIAVFVFVLFLGQKFLLPHTVFARWGMPVFALLVITVAIRPLENYIAKVTDRLLFQKKYDYQDILKSASKGMASIPDVRKLLSLITHVVTRKIRAENVSIFLLDETTNKFSQQTVRGPKKKIIDFKMDDSSPLLEWLSEKKEPLVYGELLHWIKAEKLFPHKTVLKGTLSQIKKEMDSIGAALCAPSFIENKLMGFLVLGNKLSGDMYTHEDLELLSTLANGASLAIENAQMYEELQDKVKQIEGMFEKEHRMFIHTAIAFAAAIDAKDPYTHGHSQRVTDISLQIAEELKRLPQHKNDPSLGEILRISALLHDIGKIGVPDYILSKKGKLTKEEFDEIKKHPETGATILLPIREIKDVIVGVRYHQERFDGTGYPEGLKGNNIPLIARIIGIADAYDAMTSERPYRPRLAEDVALKELKDNSGTQFDPSLVDAFMKAYAKGNIIGKQIAA